MASVTKSRHFDRSAAEVWKQIGNFDGLHTWHPAIAATRVFEGGRRRDLTLGDGGHLLETLLDQGDTFYSYRIDESPLPVANYESTIRVRDEGDGSVLEWTATFQPDGATEQEAEELLGGIFQAGIDNL
jgi:hypothetical protein